MSQPKSHRERAVIAAESFEDLIQDGPMASAWGVSDTNELAEAIAREMFPAELVQAAQEASETWREDLGAGNHGDAIGRLRAALALYLEQETP